MGQELTPSKHGSQQPISVKSIKEV